MGRPPVDIDALAQAVRANQRAGLAKAITLVESTRTDHREAAQRLLLELLPESGKAHR
jgi:LAO/AO transport system kinase